MSKPHFLKFLLESLSFESSLRVEGQLLIRQPVPMPRLKTPL